MPDADLLIAISEILETPVGTMLGETPEAIGQSAPKKQGKWNVLFWSMLLLIVGIVLIFAVLLALQSPYLHWDFNDPETAVAGTLLHGFEFLFVRMAPVLLVGAAVYMNWRYTDNIQKNAGKTLGQTTLVSSQDGEKGQEPTAAPAEDDYFATARLSRKQARDNAISMLKEAESDENAEQSVLNEASQTLQVLAAYTVAESQIESLVTAKGYADCVVFMGAESVSVVVAPPEGGLTATDAARIKDIVISETDYTAQQIKIMEAN